MFKNRLWTIRLRIFCKNDFLISMGCNLFASTPFLSIFNAIDAPRRRLHLFYKHHKQRGHLPKKVSKPYLNCWDTNLPTLVYNFLFINGHLGSIYVENLDMSNFIWFLSKMMIFGVIFQKNSFMEIIELSFCIFIN